MAISYVVGIPRSGKTYFAVYTLWDNFIKKDKNPNFFTKFFNKKTEKKNYLNAYTNINQFNYELSEKIKPLDFIEFKYKLSELHSLYIAGNDDSILIEKAKELEIYKSFILIDECHNFLKDKEDPILIWWLTYHGHLFQDIWLITQDLTLVNNEYKRIAEFFYKAIPPGQRIFKNKFRYVQYSNYRMYQTTIVKGGGFHLPYNQEVFKLYVSGAKNNSKSFIVKYIKYAIALIVILSFAFPAFLKSLNPNHDLEIEEKSKTTHEKIEVTKKDDLKIEIDEEKEEFYFEIICYFDICTYKNKEFPLTLFNRVILKNNPIFKHTIDKNEIRKHYLIFEKDVFAFLNSINGDENEKSNHNFSIFNAKR